MRELLKRIQVILGVTLMLAMGFACAAKVDAKSRQLTEDMARTIPAEIFAQSSIAASDDIAETQEEAAEALNPESAGTPEEEPFEQWHESEMGPFPDRIACAPACTVPGEEIRRRYEAAADAATLLKGSTL